MKIEADPVTLAIAHAANQAVVEKTAEPLKPPSGSEEDPKAEIGFRKRVDDAVLRLSDQDIFKDFGFRVSEIDTQINVLVFDPNQVLLATMGADAFLSKAESTSAEGFLFDLKC